MIFDCDDEQFDTDTMHTFHVNGGRVMMLMFTPDFERGFAAVLYRADGIRVESVEPHHLAKVEAEERSPAVLDAIAIFKAHGCTVSSGS